MFPVEPISYCSSRFDNFQAARAIRMTAETQRVVLHWQLHGAAIGRSDRSGGQLLRNMLFHVLVSPRPIHDSCISEIPSKNLPPF